jgi:hypothetical protein
MACSEAGTRPPIIPSLKMPDSPGSYTGLVLSVCLHAIIILLLGLEGQRLWTRTASQGDPSLASSGSGGGGGGSRVAYITLPSLPKTESPPRFKVAIPIPPPTKTAQPKSEVVPVSQPVAAIPESSATTAMVDTANSASGGRQGAGTSSGAGTSTGVGSTNGPGSGTGTGGGGQGGTLKPPEPRDMAFPFDAPPKELRGVSLNVTFWVRDDGRVERYQVEPAIADRDYARKFDEVMRAFRFTPARAPNGTRVAGVATISFTLPGKSSS